MKHHLYRAAATAAVAVLTLLTAAAADAQQPLRGRVVLGGAGAADLPVTLHRVTRDSAGVVAQSRTGAAGGFEFVLPPPDTVGGFTVFFATAEHLGVRYFGRPLHGGADAAPYEVEVFDTISVGPAGATLPLRRDMVLVSDPTGSWEINEVVTVENAQRRTLVSADGRGVWWFDLPSNASDFQVGDGGAGADGVVRMGDRVFVTTPVVPGAHEVMVRYRLAPRERGISLTLAAPVDTFRVFVRAPSPAVSVTGLQAEAEIAVEGERFLRYAGAGLAAGSTVDLAWRSGTPPVDPVHASIGVVALLLVVAAVAALRRRPGGDVSAQRP